MGAARITSETTILQFCAVYIACHVFKLNIENMQGVWHANLPAYGYTFFQK
jgi:hypothetical protein